MDGAKQRPEDAVTGHVAVGRVGGAHGIGGWVRVHSYTEPSANIFNYSPWELRLRAGWRSLRVVQGRRQGKGLVAKLAGYDDRDCAHQLQGAAIFVRRNQLPELTAEEYYWADLLGTRVVDRAGVELGHVIGLLATGANDVLRVQGDRERLIPFLLDAVVRSVDLQNRTLCVDWDADF